MTPTERLEHRAIIDALKNVLKQFDAFARDLENPHPNPDIFHCRLDELNAAREDAAELLERLGE